MSTQPTNPAPIQPVQPAHPIQTPQLLPLPGGKRAPAKFKGKYNQVKTFIRHYEKLCDQCSITTDQEICENVTLYCSSSIRRLIEILPSFRSNNWTDLKADFNSLFDADRDAKRYKVRSLVSFVNKRRSASIRTLSDWKKYTRDFVAIGGWLLAKSKISSNDHATYFWKGIPRTLRSKIETRLLVATPLRDMTTPFAFNDVSKAAEKILQRDRFDTDLVYSDTDDSESEDSDSSSNTDSDTDSSSDSEEEYRKNPKSSKKAKHKRHLHTSKTILRKTRFEDGSSDEETPIARTRKAVHKQRAAKNNTQEEVENLIQQLGRMKIGDANYSTLYYKAITLDPKVKEIVESPLDWKAKEYSMGLRDNRFPTARFSPRPNFANNTHNAMDSRNNFINMNRNTNSNYNRNTPNYMDKMICFGCGEDTHGLAACPKIEELLTKGELVRMENGRIALRGGVPLRKWTGQTIINAYENWKRSAQTHFVKSWESEYESESETDDREHCLTLGYVSDEESEEEELRTYPVYRTPKDGARKRSEVFDGVYPSKGRDAREEIKKEQRQLKTSQGIPRIERKDLPLKTIEKMNREEKEMRDAPEKKVLVRDKVPPIIQAAIERARYDAQDDDIVMEDEVLERIKSVLNRILNIPVALTAGEILGVSKEISGLLAESIKPRTMVRKETHLVYNPTKEALIELPIKIHGNSLKAVIDTGSQLNIVSEHMYEKFIKLPINRSKTLVLHDANGGKGHLKGLVSQVPVNIGAVLTTAEIYVGDSVPFDILLGRPWQIHNVVSIHERPTGTWLEF
ncbi:uncharacterized protein F5147DRAFT_592260, partial [Suillus discolor]